MSAPRWDAMADWDADELLDAYCEFQERSREDPADEWAERRFLWVREEILRRLERERA